MALFHFLDIAQVTKATKNVGVTHPPVFFEPVPIFSGCACVLTFTHVWSKYRL